jgi:hypothetical protein
VRKCYENVENQGFRIVTANKAQDTNFPHSFWAPNGDIRYYVKTDLG